MKSEMNPSLFTGPSGSPLRILVCGDVMLDVYRIGMASRISPEAPVPILLNPVTEYRLGGAGAVAAMCRALGADVILIGVIGCDRNGEIVRELAESLGIACKLSNSPFPRPTTAKERICAVASGRHRQQLGRIDTEYTVPIGTGEAVALSDMISGEAVDLIILADYAKGVCTDRVIQACRNTDAPVFVDPPKGVDWTKYYGVECVVPNRQEAAHKTARDLCRQVQTKAAVVKLDEEGCELATQGGWVVERYPARARSIHDVTSCGDQFVATLACARASGLDWSEAAELANAAAGLQAGRHGATPVTTAELLEEIKHADRDATTPVPDVVGSLPAK